jgi:hypothetical protein
VAARAFPSVSVLDVHRNFSYAVDRSRTICRSSRFSCALHFIANSSLPGSSPSVKLPGSPRIR